MNLGHGLAILAATSLACYADRVDLLIVGMASACISCMVRNNFPAWQRPERPTPPPPPPPFKHSS